MRRKALALLSGGLDSTLAIKLLLEQGIEVEAAHYHIEFAACGGMGDENAANKAAKKLGVYLEMIDITAEYLEVFKNPQYGYGANINPCIDCKIFMLKKAKKRMAEVGASFLVTGEVLGQRPMSQRRDALNIISKRADVKGILLRPLCAKLLEPTLPEREGIVDREKLMAITGRSRKPQMDLAAQYGIKDYPNPAGGCLLTDPGFTRRVKDLIAHDELTIENLQLLKYGRHFRLSDKAKLVVGRDAEDNDEVEALAGKGDICFRLKDHQGPFSMIRGAADEALIRQAAGIVAYHSKLRNEGSIRVDYWHAKSIGKPTALSIQPASLAEVDNVRVK